MRPTPSLRPTVYVPAGVPLSTLIELAETASEEPRHANAPNWSAHHSVARTAGKRYPSAVTPATASRFVATLAPAQT